MAVKSQTQPQEATALHVRGEAMRRINNDESLTRECLTHAGARLLQVPHRALRAVVVKSDLVQKTDSSLFRGLLNTRNIVSLLFGHQPGTGSEVLRLVDALSSPPVPVA